MNKTVLLFLVVFVALVQCYNMTCSPSDKPALGFCAIKENHKINEIELANIYSALFGVFTVLAALVFGACVCCSCILLPCTCGFFVVNELWVIGNGFLQFFTSYWMLVLPLMLVVLINIQ